MRCLSVTRWLPRSGSVTRGKVAQGDDSITYRVAFDSPLATVADAITAEDDDGNFVAPFDATIGLFVCSKKSAERDTKSPNEWTVTATFTLPQPGEEAAPEDLDEVEGDRWAVEITRNTVVRETEVQRNYPLHPGGSSQGKPLVNSSLDPVTGITLPVHDEEILLSFTTNLLFQSAFNDCYDANGHPCSNSEAFALIINGEETIFDVDTVVYDGRQVSAVVDASGAYYTRVTLRLLWKKDGWRYKAADKGVFELITHSGITQRIPIEDGSGNFITSPVYLDGAGSPLTLDPLEPAHWPNAVILKDPEDGEEGFRIRGRADLATLILWGLHT